jgi:hypothetical protein
MSALLDDANIADLMTLNRALIAIGAQALQKAAGSPHAILGVVRLSAIEQG